MLEQIEQYEGLIKHMIAKYDFYHDYDDLYQAGMMGLVKACQKYDQSKESNFLDYAYFYIKGEVLKALNANRQLKISNETYQLQKEIQTTAADLTQTLGRQATSYEIAYVLGTTPEKIEQTKNMMNSVYSLDQTSETEDIGLYNKIAKIEMGYDAGILDLKTALAGLEASDRELITSRYYEDKTQQETADLLGISQVQVSRKEKKILEKLKTSLYS